MGTNQNRFTNGKWVIRSDSLVSWEEERALAQNLRCWVIVTYHDGLASEGMVQPLGMEGEMGSV